MTQPASLQARLQHSWFLRLALGLVLVIGAVAIVQLSVTVLPVPRLVQKILLVVTTLPAAIGAYVGLFRRVERRAISELGWEYAVRETGFGIISGGLLFGAILFILWIVGAVTVSGGTNWGALVIPLLIAITSAVFEEILFRGVLFRLLEEGLGSWLGLMVSALIFGGLHLINENATAVGAAAVALTAGLMLPATYMLTRRLWLPIGIHLGWNFTQSGIFGVAVSGNNPLPGLVKSSLSGPDWLTGGQFGVEASVVTVVLLLILTGIMLVVIIRRGDVVRAPWSGRRS